MIPQEVSHVADRFISFSGRGFQISLIFASNRGRDAFIKKWPEIREQLEALRATQDDSHPRLPLQ